MGTGKYTIMGQVIDGNDTLDKMEKIPVGEFLQSHLAWHKLRLQTPRAGKSSRNAALGSLLRRALSLEPRMACMYVALVCIFARALSNILTFAANAGAADRPLQEIRLRSVTIHANPMAN